jgi:branched-chain amino acid transport system ATP-binding protein
MPEPRKLGDRAPREALLDVKALEVSYGAIKALKGIALSVGKGEAVALIGANGAGKTSTLRAISGMLKPQAGVITLRGENVTGLKSHQMVPRGMAHAPEGRGVFPNLTVMENLDLGAYLRRDAAGIAADLKKVFGYFPILDERKAQMAGTLSGGEQQMLAISRALMSRPTLLLLDEPSLGLAPLMVTQILEMVKTLAVEANIAVLLVEQNAVTALRVAGHAVVLNLGTVVMAGTASDIASHEELRHAYLGY